MKNLKSIFAIAITFLLSVHAMAQNWEWAISAGGTEGDYAAGIVNDNQGNVYVTGNFKGTATFGDKKLTSGGYYDIFIAKYTPQGKLLWLSQAGGAEGDESYGITIDEKNNTYITGYFSGTANFGSLVVKSSGDRDFFICKYDANGNPVWVQHGGGDQAEFGKALAIDHKGNISVAGVFGGKAMFQNTLLKTKGEEDIFIANYSSDGNLNWIKTISGNGKDAATAIATDANGNSYVTGWFSGLADFGKESMTSDGDDDIFVAKLNPKGEILWANKAGGFKGVDRSYGIAVDAKGNAYVTGSIIGNVKFNAVNLKSTGTDDCFLAKYNTDGKLQWVKASGGKNGEVGRAIAMDSSGNIFVCGDFNATYICNSTTNCVGDWDIFVVKYDANGNVIGGNHAGGEGYDRPVAMSIDLKGNCYMTGVYDKTCIFGKHELVNMGSSDIFISKTTSFDPIL